MKHFGLVQVTLMVVVGALALGSSLASAAPNARYGVLLNIGYSTFEPDSELRAVSDEDAGYRLGFFFDPDGESDRGFELDISWVNFGNYEYCVRDVTSLGFSPDQQVCSEFEADGLELGGSYVIPLGRLSSRRSVLDKFSLFLGAGYFDLDYNASNRASVDFEDNDEGTYWEAGLLWTGGFGERAENFGVRASYRAHDNQGIEYWSIGLVWDL